MAAASSGNFFLVTTDRLIELDGVCTRLAAFVTFASTSSDDSVSSNAFSVKEPNFDAFADDDFRLSEIEGELCEAESVRVSTRSASA
jgi:hypothetical protein